MPNKTPRPTRIYVASSWRNTIQQDIVRALRRAGHEVYDFRNPRQGDTGFHWSAIDGDWLTWTPRQFREALKHPIAQAGFKSDHDAMEWANTCVLVLPCGRSAHLEAGEFIGKGKRLFVYTETPCEPELMYLGATEIALSIAELLEAM